jgi:hypothetical protein
MKSELQQLLINDFEELAGGSYLGEKWKIDKPIFVIFDENFLVGNAVLSVLLFFVIRVILAGSTALCFHFRICSKDYFYDDSRVGNVNNNIEMLNLLLTIAIVVVIVVLSVRGAIKSKKKEKYNFKRKYAHLLSLKHEVEKHNKIIEDIDILDQSDGIIRNKWLANLLFYNKLYNSQQFQITEEAF